MKAFTLGIALAACAAAHGGTVYLDASQYLLGDRNVRIVQEVARRADVADRLTFASRERLQNARRYDLRIPFVLPTTVVLQNRMRDTTPKVRGNLSLVFDTGSTAFPIAYRDLLESVFDQARNTLNQYLGLPSEAGDVRVTNADATIPDRAAVAGGIYVAGSAGARQILFPVYSSPEAAAVNFLHTLALAHFGRDPWPYDAQQEGLVRAVVMAVVRTPGALPATLDVELLEAALANTYDVGAWYDWFNQPALATRDFIPANLFNTDLPSGGSVGGPYLLRHQMAGSAWFKVMVQNPSVIAGICNRFYAAGVSLAEEPAFSIACQAALDEASATTNALIEGQLFADWLKKQFVLQRKLTLGPKVLVQPVPLPPEAGTTDFGVFDVVTHYFETRANGDEILLSGTSFPIFWENTFNRVFPSAQEDRMDIAGAYGSVTPNLPNLNAGQPYRCAIDIPVTDRLQRAYVPAGAIATGADTSENNFYGTVIGLGNATSAKVRVRIGNSTVGNAPIVNGAFGITITNTLYPGFRRLQVEVLKTVNSVESVVLTRFVNKSVGALALDLRIGGTIEFGPAGGLPKGLSLLGFSAEPYLSDPVETLGPNALVARYNPSRAAYDLFPDSGDFRLGHAYFVRANTANPSFSVTSRFHPGTPTAVALRPGWNLITTALPELVPTSRVRVIKGANFPQLFTDALGTDIGLDFFGFTPGANDPATGAPETGTFSAVTSFQPGRGYFVRCLAPEGVTLLFEPETPLTRARVATVPKAPTWVLRAAITKGRNVAMAFLGAAPDARSTFDRAYDSNLPPSFGAGLQIAVEGKAYRDVRNLTQDQRFRLRISGLVPGQRYELKLIEFAGRVGEFTLVDGAVRVNAKIRAPFSYPFKATSANRVMDIHTEGRYR